MVIHGLWFVFGLVCLWYLSRIVFRICLTAETCAVINLKTWESRVQAEMEKRKCTESLERTQIVIVSEREEREKMKQRG